MAKTYKNLYPQISAFETLYLAWRKARRGKRYKPSVAAFEQNLDAELLARIVQKLIYEKNLPLTSNLELAENAPQMR